MKKITLSAFVVMFLMLNQLVAQSTFETFINITKIYGAEQIPDGTYIVCFDSAGSGIMKLDKCGDRMWTNFPQFRTSAETIFDISSDPYSGGYIAGGSSTDTSINPYPQPFIMQLDAGGNFGAGRLLDGGAAGGNVSSVRITPDSGYVAGIFQQAISLVDVSNLKKVDLVLDDVWEFQGLGSQVNSSSVDINSNTEYSFSSFNDYSSGAPAIRQLDIGGMIQNTFVIPDTFQGGVSFFSNAVVDHDASDEYFIGATLTPTGSGVSSPYFLKLDNAFNVVWQKVFSWGASAEVLSVVSGPGNGVTCMLNRQDTVIFLHLDSQGDSSWSRTYTGIGSVKPNQMRRCSDGGYIVSGSTSNGIDNFGFILKLDSLAMLLPSVCVQAGGSTEICPGSSVTLTADSGYQYMWSTLETTQSIEVSSAGSYFVTVSDSVSGLSAQSEPIDVSIYSTTNPTISLLVSLLVSSPAVTYQWLLNGDTLVGETNSDLTPLVTGDYSVIVTDANGCILTSAPYTYLMPGIKELEKVKAFELTRIGSDFLELSIHIPETGTIRLIDVRGAVLKEVAIRGGKRNAVQIPVADLSAGIYSLLWLSDNSTQSQKVLIGK